MKWELPTKGKVTGSASCMLAHILNSYINWSEKWVKNIIYFRCNFSCAETWNFQHWFTVFCNEVCHMTFSLKKHISKLQKALTHQQLSITYQKNLEPLGTSLEYMFAFDWGLTIIIWDLTLTFGILPWFLLLQAPKCQNAEDRNPCIQSMKNNINRPV